MEPGTTPPGELTASTAFDVQGKVGALPPAIGRVAGTGVVAGPAVTVACVEGSVTGVLAALDAATPGSVVVIQGAGEWAYFGELTGSEAVRAGAVAVVIDAYTRDVPHLRELPLSVFARGLTPRGAGFGADGRVGVDLVVGDTTVRPGDWVVGDDDGVTVVPAENVDQVVRDAAERARSEGDLAASVLAGTSLLDHPGADGRPLRALLEGTAAPSAYTNIEGGSAT